MVFGELDEKTLERLLYLVHRHAGITMAKNRGVMLQSRLRPRMRELGISEYNQYVDYLEKDSGEIPLFVDSVTTNETYFHLTPRVWEYFSQVFLKNWIQEKLVQNPGKTLQIWSAASSSGEEAYTLAMYCEEVRQKNPKFQYKIRATDISNEILESARAGIYGDRSVELLQTLQPQFFQKYFERVDSKFKVVKELKSHVEFSQHNLFNRTFFKEPFDIVFLRNVLIYFVAADQEIVLRNIHRAMKGGGTLVIGEAESLGQISVPYKFISPLIYEGIAA